jgi:MYXO-CTERM domain-containing protein
MDSDGWCYLGSNGYAVMNDWVQDSKGWCYLNNKGNLAKSVWVDIGDGNKTYVNKSGYRASGMMIIDGYNYYFYANGVYSAPTSSSPYDKFEVQFIEERNSNHETNLLFSDCGRGVYSMIFDDDNFKLLVNDEESSYYQKSLPDKGEKNVSIYYIAKVLQWDSDDFEEVVDPYLFKVGVEFSDDEKKIYLNLDEDAYGTGVYIAGIYALDATVSENWAPVPEPTTATLSLLALAALASRRRRK